MLQLVLLTVSVYVLPFDMNFMLQRLKSLIMSSLRTG